MLTQQLRNFLTTQYATVKLEDNTTSQNQVGITNFLSNFYAGSPYSYTYSNGTGTGKVVEKLEHWFQTFEMGDGTFNIESAVIPPVLVLLDRHGWEIMRKPLPQPYSSDEGLDALRAYNSPLVKEYKFYSSATKATGCHKYTVLKKGEEQNQIKVNGLHYTSTSLASLPPETATGVKDNKGAFNDQFVTYTVKDEYENSYSYAYDEETGDETETPSKFLVLQNCRFARDN